MIGRLFRKRPVDPFSVTVGTVQALIECATERRDMTTVGKLTAALNLINRESLRAGR